MLSSPHFDRNHFYQATPAPSVIARRNGEAQAAASVCISYSVVVLFLTFVIALLLYEGALQKLWLLWLRLHPDLVSWLSLVFVGSVTIILVGRHVHLTFNEYWSIRSFLPLYRTCRYSNSFQLMHYRLPYVMAAHPERFSYSFSGQTIVIEIRKIGQTDPSVSTKVLEPEDFSFLEPASSLSESAPALTVNLLESPLPADEEKEEDPASSPVPVEADDTASPVSPQKDERPVQQQELIHVEARETASEAQSPSILSADIQQRLRVIILLCPATTFVLKEKRDNSREEGPSEIRVSFPLTYLIYQALMAFFAQDPQKLVHVEKVMGQIYPDIDDKKSAQSLFNKHISRIRGHTKTAISRAFPHWAEAVKDFDVFYNEMSGQNSSWRLSTVCIVAGLDLLKNFYLEISTLARVKKGQSSHDPVKEQKLLNNAQRLIRYYSGNYLEKHPHQEAEYVGGFLVEQLDELPFREWATPFFKECRRKYLFCLEQVALREGLLWQEVKQSEHLEYATKLYKECACAATCAPIDHKSGERALRAYLTLYRQAEEGIEEAEAFYETYRRRICRVEAEWVPEKETRALLDAIGFVEE